MKYSFTIEQKQLIAILSASLPICTKRTTIESTASLLLHVRSRELIVKCTDLEVALQISHTLDQEPSTDPISVLISCKRLHDIVKELEGSIQLTIESHAITLISGSGSITLHTADASQFPPFPERIENLMHIDSARCMELIRTVSMIIPAHHTNSALTGLLWEIGPEGLTMTTTDGHCLAHVKDPSLTLSESRSWLVPRRAVLELQKIVETMRESVLFIGLCGKQLVISGESFNFFTKLLSGTFPQYAPVLDHTQFYPARVQRPALLKTVRRAATLLSGQFIAAQFSFMPTRITVQLMNKDVGTLHEEIPLEGFSGEACETRLYAPYVLNGLTGFELDHITMYVHSPLKPVMFAAERPSGISHMYLVMPVAIPTT